MKSFNTQFATQRLRSLNEEVKFNIEDSDLYTAIMDTYMSDTPMPIRDEGDYLVTDDATYQNLQNIAAGLNKEDALVKVDDIEEESATGAGANFVPGTGEQYTTPKAFKKTIDEETSDQFIVNKVWDFLESRPFYNKEYMPKFSTAEEIYNEFGPKELKMYSDFDWKGNTEPIHPREKAALHRIGIMDKKSIQEKDVEPKLAAGKAKVYMKDKWGWKDAPSIPNRPSKGGFIYKQLYEGEINENVNIPQNIVNFAKKKGISSELNMIANWVEEAGKTIVGGTAIGKNYSTLILDLTHQGSEIYYNMDNESIEVNGQPVETYEEFLKALTTEWPTEVPSRYREYIFKLVKVMPDGAKYDVIDVETGKKELGGRIYGSVESLKYAADDLVKPQGGTQSTQLEEGIDTTYESLVKILETLHSFSDKIEFSTQEVNGYYNIVYDDPEQITKDSLKALRSREFWNTEFVPSVAIFDNNRVNIHFEKPAQEILNIKDFNNSNWTPKKLKQSVNENYSRFKKETKTRTNEQQLHAAMRLAERKIHEANRVLEYTAQLRGELNETRVNKNTQHLMEKITKGIAAAYGKMKKLK